MAGTLDSPAQAGNREFKVVNSRRWARAGQRGREFRGKRKEPDCSGSVVMRSLTLSPSAQKSSEANRSLLSEPHCQQDLSANPYRTAAAACTRFDLAIRRDVQIFFGPSPGSRTSLKIEVLPRERTIRASGVWPVGDRDSAKARSLPGPETSTQTCRAAARAG